MPAFAREQSGPVEVVCVGMKLSGGLEDLQINSTNL